MDTTDMHALNHGVARDTVCRLATLRKTPVISSLYLDVDGAHRPVPATYQQAFEQMADELRRRARARDDPRVGRSVEGDVERMRAWLGKGIDRTVTRGVALFSCHEQGYFESLEVFVPVRDEAGIGYAPRIRQLLEVLDAPGPFLLALVDGTHLRLFVVDSHQINEHPTFVTRPERAVDTSVELGSWERHHAEVRRRHLRHAATEVDEAVRSLSVHQLVLGGPDEAVTEFTAFLHPTTRQLVIGQVGIRVAAPTEEIAPAARAVADRAERNHERALVEEVRQRTAGEHGGVIGLEATLAALTERRVSTLLIGDGFTAPGASCPSCGHIGPDLRLCPACHATNVEIDDVVEVAIQLAVAQGADLEFCVGTELDRSGVAAIARY
jgi:hypothetical protein